ncbi:MAG: glycine cleavage system protein GcvH [Phycisphaerae bacterium]|nr:glycine cleavage system protein GcvH [Phycisphaerae bacterium]
MNIPDDRKYSETHEWYLVDGDVVTMGITQFAADELTDITYVELPDADQEIEAGQPCGELESVKATSDLLCSVGGTVIGRNDELADQPELINEDALGAGWMLKIRVADLSPLEKLLDAAAYEKHIAED